MPDMKKIMEWTHRLRESADANVSCYIAMFLACCKDLV